MSASELKLSAPLNASAPRASVSLWAACTLSALLGLVLLTAGVLKAFEPFNFVRQIAGFHILPWKSAHLAAAWFFVVAECAVGAALVVGYRMRLSLALAAGLTLLFLGALGYVKLAGIPVEDCGCFGSQVKRSPTEAMIEDGLMLAAAVAALWLARANRPAQWTGRWRVAVVSTFALFGFATPLAFGFPFGGADFQNVVVTGVTVDLKRGEHLVALIDTECTHCQQSVPALNAFADAKDVPKLVALCSNEDWRRNFFVKRYEAKFPLGEISKDDFKRLLADGDTPRILYLRSGKIVASWNVTPPTLDEVRKLRR
jgi:uncharacterized membrane protein YphA (DoxX/SURF4 family)